MEDFIEKINEAGIEYNFGVSNCIDIAKGIFLYARGFVKESFVICKQFLASKMPILVGEIPVNVNMAMELKNFMM